MRQLYTALHEEKNSGGAKPAHLSLQALLGDIEARLPKLKQAGIAVDGLDSLDSGGVGAEVLAR